MLIECTIRIIKFTMLLCLQDVILYMLFVHLSIPNLIILGMLLKFLFINKGIDFIDLTSISRDKSVAPSIPMYFKNSEPTIICYEYNKPINNTIFNFN